MIGVLQHYLGDLPSARLHLEHALVGYVTPDQTSHIIRFHADQRVAMSVFLARVLWLQGFPDQATRAAHSTVEDAHAANHTISLCLALAYAGSDWPAERKADHPPHRPAEPIAAS